MNNSSIRDKSLECERYDARARYLISKKDEVMGQSDGAESVALPYRSPYIAFVEQLNLHLSTACSALEIGAGTGAFTGVLLRSGARICATDISSASLEVLAKRYKNVGQLEVKVADMENLPFPDNSFDLVSSAGSLSYGDNSKAKNEIYRVLKKNGVFVCVDSLHHNPIYRLNRVVNYFLGNRTKSTLRRMPTIDLLTDYRKCFGSVDVYFFGAISYLMPLFTRLFGVVNASRFSDLIDRKVKVKKSAFKFVMVASKTDVSGTSDINRS